MMYDHAPSTVASAPLLANLQRGPKYDRIDTAVMSLVRGTGDDLLHALEFDHEVFIVPLRPLHLSAATRQFTGDFSLRVCPYTLCLLHAGYEYEFTAIRCEDLLVLGVESAWFSAVRQRCVTDDVTIARPVDTLLHPDIPPLIHAFQRHLSLAECPDEPYLPMLTELLVARFFWLRQRQGLTETPSTGLTIDKLHGILLIIEEQLDQRIMVTSLARAVAMSPSRFSRAFKATLGMSPQRYILERRVLRVQDLLTQSTLSLADVSLEAGFSSQAHMTAMFTRHFGITPGGYRKHARGDADD